MSIQIVNKKFLDEFYLLIKNNKFHNFKFIKKLFLLKKCSKKITLLKSPHVNKTAQEHFEKQVVVKQFQIRLFRNKKYLIFLKKLNSYLFPNLKVKLTLLINKKNQNLNLLNMFTLKNFKLNKYKKIKSNNLKPNRFLFLKQTSLKLNSKIYQSLEITDIFGEFLSFLLK